MSQNSLEKAHENIANVIYQAVLNPHFDKEMIIQACEAAKNNGFAGLCTCLLYTSPSPRDGLLSRMPSSA